MQCTSPFLLKLEDGSIIEVPCNNCLSCKIARQKEWALRMMNEQEYHEHSVFVTLTYDPEHCPEQIEKRELQLFFKRVRKELGTRKIKYYACGEYGEKSKRPHYHAIIFGMSGFGDDKNILKGAWNVGFVYTGSVTHQSCRYVAKYVQKKYNGERRTQEYGDKQPPFQLQSQGLGKAFALDNKDRLKENLVIPYQGVEHSLPRYYRKKLNLDKSVYQSIVDEKRIETFKELIKRAGSDNLVDIHNELKKARIQADKNIKARTGLKSDKL